MNLAIASVPLKVQAATGPTLGEYILTIFASLGISFTDSNLLDALKTYCGMGINGLDSATIQSAISKVEGQIGYTPITKMLSNTAEMGQAYATAVGAENFGATSIGAASAAENIHASIIQFPQTGTVAPVIGGTPLLTNVIQGLGAVAAGVALGIALNKVYETLKGWVEMGQSAIYTSGITSGAAFYRAQGWYNWGSKNPQLIVGVGTYNGKEGIWLVNNTDKAAYIGMTYGRTINGAGNAGWSLDANAHSIGGATKEQMNMIKMEGTPLGSVEEYLKPGASFPGAEIDNTITSNGVVGPNNLWGEEFYNATQEMLKPLNMDEYETWAQNAAENTENGGDGKIDWQAFLEMAQPYIIPITGPGGVPVGPLPGTESSPVYPAQPEYVPYPENNPQPVPTTIPGTTPGVDPNPTLAPGATPGVMPEPTALPIVPPQEELDPQEQTEMLGQTTINGLASIFPFCIPFDLKDLITKFNSIERKAPAITWNADFGGYGNFGDVTIDLSRFDNAAYIFRLLISIEYLIGLMLLSRYIIGGN